MKYAQFADPKWKYVAPMIVGEKDAEFTKIPRISEWVDIEWQPRSAEEIVPEQLAALDNDIAEVTEKFGHALAELKARKQELLALTNQAEVA